MASRTTAQVDFDDALAATTSASRDGKLAGDILPRLSDDQRTKVLRALADVTVSGARIADALTRMGFPCARGAIETWRAKVARTV